MTRITAFLISSVPQKTTRICKIEVKENEVTLLQEAQKISKMVLCLGRIFIKKKKKLKIMKNLYERLMRNILCKR